MYNVQCTIKNKNSQFQNGQSLMEVIIAAAVGILVVSALTFATIFSLRNASFSKASIQATKLAQEGIERVRTGRNRNSSISMPATTVTSWNGEPDRAGSAIWDYQINGNCGDTRLTPPTYCYFNVTDQGVLNYQVAGSTIPGTAESIPPLFQRAVILSDDATTYTNQKKVTVIVTWTDSSGAHESKLTTILGKKF